MKEGFYRAFEDKYRGSRESIRDRLEAYLPFVLPLKEIYPNGMVIDIGCGRGEWLELLMKNEINAQGIDLDEGMLDVSRGLGLDVTQGDGIAMLEVQPDESAIVISAFHVVEHISFEQLQILISEALRILKPGGLLILETPNPENIKVATENFYLDPTHTRPIPSALLSFMTEYSGYGRSKIVRLQEPEGLSEQHFATIRQIVEGVSPDYAVIAQKNAIPEIFDTLDEAFSKEYGLSFLALSEKFEVWMQSVHSDTENTNRKLAKVQEDVHRTWAHADKILAISNEALAQSNEALAQSNEALAQSNELQHTYQLMLSSTSWRITKPLRFASDQIRWFSQGLTAWITFAPGSRPRRILQRLLPESETSAEETKNGHDISTKTEEKEEKDIHDILSPRAEEIYYALKIEDSNKAGKH